jgi:uncharacterized FlaG/YvyC family protein
MVNGNVDKITNFLREKKTSTPGDISKALALPKKEIQSSLDQLAKEGKIKLDKKLTGVKVSLMDASPAIVPLPPQAPQIIPEPPKPVQSNQPQSIPPSLPDKATPSQPPLPDKPALEIPPPTQSPFPDKPIEAPPLPSQPLPDKPIGEAPPPAPNAPDQKVMIGTPNKVAKSEKPEPTVPEMKKPDDYPFLLGDNKQQEIKEVKPRPVENKPTLDHNPLESHSPRFDMAAPDPEMEGPISLKPVETYSGDDKDKVETYPEEVRTSVDKIEFLMDKLEEKLRTSDYKDLNLVYRKIHKIYQESDELSPNERHILVKRINELFDRVKTIYLMDSSTF